MEASFRGEVAVVTGAGVGIGLAIARGLARARRGGAAQRCGRGTGRGRRRRRSATRAALCWRRRGRGRGGERARAGGAGGGALRPTVHRGSQRGAHPVGQLLRLRAERLPARARREPAWLLFSGAGRGPPDARAGARRAHPLSLLRHRPSGGPLRTRLQHDQERAGNAGAAPRHRAGPARHHHQCHRARRDPHPAQPCR